jgi:hypothetical protein
MQARRAPTAPVDLTLEADDLRLMQDNTRGATEALHRCVTTDGVDHFLSGASCDGQISQGLVGWMFPDPIPGTRLLSRCVKVATRGHLSTLDPAVDWASETGYVVDGAQGYVPGTDPLPFLDDQPPIYRFCNGGTHLFSRDNAGGAAAGYIYERVAFRVLRSQGRDAGQRLFACTRRGSGHPFVSLDEGCEGQDVGCPLGWIFCTSLPGTAALTRCAHPTTADQLVTVDGSECARAGYAIVGVLGYVPVL